MEKGCINKKMIEGNFRYCNCNCEVCKEFKCKKHLPTKTSTGEKK